MVDVWLEYQGITRTEDIQYYFHNYLAEYMIDNTYNRFIIQRAEGSRTENVDSNDDYVDDENPPFGRINGAPRCEIALHAIPTKKRRSNRDGTENQYLLQGEYKV